MSDHTEIKDFLSAMSTDTDQFIKLARGTITQADGGNKLVNVKLGGSGVEVVSIRYFDHYIPAINDDVHVIICDGDMFVLGKIARP